MCVYYDFIDLLHFVFIRWNMRKESNDFIVSLLFFSSHSQSHLYFIWWEALETMQSCIYVYIYRSNDVLFNHARDCDRAERNNRWNDSYERAMDTFRQFVILDDLSMLICIWKTQTDTKHSFFSIVSDILLLLFFLLRLLFVIEWWTPYQRRMTI